MNFHARSSLSVADLSLNPQAWTPSILRERCYAAAWGSNLEISSKNRGRVMGALRYPASVTDDRLG